MLCSADSIHVSRFRHLLHVACHRRNHYRAGLSRRGAYLGEDAALINCADNSWRHILLSSDRLADKLPPTITAKEAIHDLPADVTPGSHSYQVWWSSIAIRAIHGMQ